MREDLQDFYNFPQFATQYCHYKLATPTIQHWQLRDLVHCENSEEVYITEGFGIYKVNLKKQVKTLVHQLEFKPTCFSIYEGVLAAGGQSGKLKVLRLEDGRSFFAGNVGNQVNNSVLLTKRRDEKLLFLVNNNCALHCFRLVEDCSLEMVGLCCFESPTCLNHVALSPDGRLLLTVGDSGESFIYNVEGDFSILSSFRISLEPVVSCSWSADGHLFAVASQDDHVYLFDSATEKRIGKLSSRQSNGFRGACRCVKFSPCGVLDLMAFTEHANCVHLVDIRDLSRSQPEFIGETERDVDIAGLCFNPHGDKLFVGCSQGIYAYYIGTAQRRSFGKGDFT
ncbi:Uncharacterized protein Gasu2_35930 [Galdieria sulphuraria]|uniref:DUF2415 domain-containing protein n=1 Tax=Galdieria sulphuraria TaxID=130081 RepID=M2XU36_GALSU|nr:uncharacterized protein Gasu_52800 [Galdieria sulphuraria]EME27178.1 hypothetical protein Gasu_52800 [Galdieria sulphuraria]GJD09336.1 Uncharacterized protein Gasu2_35930 [Galdieria sulphuraria]|eukprot:XP_005703698.1 hypothetical protein Gasu_52800 [Galdieria sulphuraria]